MKVFLSPDTRGVHAVGSKLSKQRSLWTVASAPWGAQELCLLLPMEPTEESGGHVLVCSFSAVRPLQWEHSKVRAGSAVMCEHSGLGEGIVMLGSFLRS